MSTMITIQKHKAIAPGLIFSLMLVANLLIALDPVLAHHPMGGKIPVNFMEGFLSGLGHPVIGLDHLVFVIAIGLLAALFQNKLGVIIPLVFTIATAMGTGIHLLSIDLPVPEIIISASVLVMGVFLAKEDRGSLILFLILLIILGAIAGIFHGYAYGESIIGAEITALGAYLLGFSSIQLIISALAFACGRLIISKADLKSNLIFRFAGFTICGIGFTFLSSAILG